MSRIDLWRRTIPGSESQDLSSVRFQACDHPTAFSFKGKHWPLRKSDYGRGGGVTPDKTQGHCKNRWCIPSNTLWCTALGVQSHMSVLKVTIHIAIKLYNLGTISFRLSLGTDFGMSGMHRKSHAFSRRMVVSLVSFSVLPYAQERQESPLSWPYTIQFSISIFFIFTFNLVVPGPARLHTN